MTRAGRASRSCARAPRPALPPRAEGRRRDGGGGGDARRPTARWRRPRSRAASSPWAEALLQALRTWRFAAGPATAPVAFRVQADFVAAGRDAAARRPEAAATSRAAVAGAAPRPTPRRRRRRRPPARRRPRRVARSRGAPAPPARRPRRHRAPAPPPRPRRPPPAAPAPPPARRRRQRPQPRAGRARAARRGALSGRRPSPRRPAAPAAAARGLGRARRDAGAGVPDLVEGPPAGGAAAGAHGGRDGHGRGALRGGRGRGQRRCRSVTGPELLKEAARQAVASWVFRRTTRRAAAPGGGVRPTRATQRHGRSTESRRGERAAGLLGVGLRLLRPWRRAASRPAACLLRLGASSAPWPWRALAAAFASALALGRGLLALLVLLLGLVLRAEQLDDRHLRAVALARAQAQDARVAARDAWRSARRGCRRASSPPSGRGCRARPGGARAAGRRRAWPG